MPKTMSECRRFFGGTLTPPDIEAAVEAAVRGTFAESTIKRLARQEAKNRARGEGWYTAETDVLLCNGDLRVEGDLSTGERPWIRMLIVLGDLDVSERFEDCLDPESIVVVTGNLSAKQLVSEGFLEVGGDVRVTGSALFLDNDGCAEIFGDLVSDFLYTKYHAVQVHGRAVATLTSGDARHIRAPHEYDFVTESDPRMRELVARDVLVIEGDEAGEWWIDHADTKAMVERVRAGRPILLEPASANRETIRPVAPPVVERPAAVAPEQPLPAAVPLAEAPPLAPATASPRARKQKLQKKKKKAKRKRK